MTTPPETRLNQGTSPVASTAVRSPNTEGLSSLWQPIQTAPKDGVPIILGFAGSGANEGYWHDGSKNHWGYAGWYFSDDNILTSKPNLPTHWQPLPEPPQTPLVDNLTGALTDATGNCPKVPRPIEDAGESQ
jgi:hypothetical protein